jgi:3D (Asp-Asp-Asp) domain-containing protein
VRQANRRFTNKNARQRRPVGHDRLTSRPTRLQRGWLAAVSRCQKSARPQGLARRGCSESEVEAAFLRLSASRIGCSTRDSTTSEQPQNTMRLFYTVIFFSLLASAAFAREESILARVTSYWAGEGSKFASTGRRLHSGHCAVDPKRIPYGSKVVFPDRACTAVDTGPAVISRKAARLCGRTASQLKAIVVDRFFETKREAMAWTNTHPHFMTLQVVRPGSHSEPPEL